MGEKKSEKQFKGNEGIFLVAAKLSKMKLIALTTSRNTKGYDIVVLNPMTNKGKGIQVKCTDRKDFPILNMHTEDYEKELRQKITCDYVLVDISNNIPRFLVIPQQDMLKILEKKVRDWTARNHKVRHEETGKKKQLWTINISKMEGELNKYEDNWESILKGIR